MDYNTFKNEIFKSLEKCFEELRKEDTARGTYARKYNLELTTVPKVNIIRDGIVLSPVADGNIGPVLYLDAIYQEFCDSCEKMEEIVAKTLSLIDKILINPDQEISPCLSITPTTTTGCSIEAIKKAIKSGELYIIPLLVQTINNDAFINDCPHRAFKNLTVIYKLVHFGADTDDAKISIKITDEVASELGYTEETLYQESLANLRSHFAPVVENLMTIVQEFMPVDEGLEMGDSPLLVVTNNFKFNGANALLLPDVFKNIADDLGCNLFILPSSIHEVLVLPDFDNERLSGDKLFQMVQEVNATCVVVEEVLTDALYYFNRETNGIELLFSTEVNS